MYPLEPGDTWSCPISLPVFPRICPSSQMDLMWRRPVCLMLGLFIVQVEPVSTLQLITRHVRSYQDLNWTKTQFDPRVGKILWRRKWQPTPVFSPRKSHGWRNRVGYSPWGHKELDTTEQLSSNKQVLPVILSFEKSTESFLFSERLRR